MNVAERPSCSAIFQKDMICFLAVEQNGCETVAPINCGSDIQTVWICASFQVWLKYVFNFSRYSIILNWRYDKFYFCFYYYDHFSRSCLCIDLHYLFLHLYSFTFYWRQSHWWIQRSSVWTRSIVPIRVKKILNKVYWFLSKVIADISQLILTSEIIII